MMLLPHKVTHPPKNRITAEQALAITKHGYESELDGIDKKIETSSENSQRSLRLEYIESKKLKKAIIDSLQERGFTTQEQTNQTIKVSW